MIELLSETLAHFVRRAIGEGDGDNLIDRKLALAQNVQVTLDEHRGFAGTRAGSYRDVPGYLVCCRGLLRL